MKLAVGRGGDCSEFRHSVIHPGIQQCGIEGSPLFVGGKGPAIIAPRRGLPHPLRVGVVTEWSNVIDRVDDQCWIAY